VAAPCSQWIACSPVRKRIVQGRSTRSLAIMKTRVSTDTATIVLFDPACLRHRLHDDADWWSIPNSELAEVNAGNAAFLNLGADGTYDLEILANGLSSPGAEILVRNTSGRFFLGAGEHVSSEGFEPEAEFGNIFLEMPPGTYLLRARLSSPNHVELSPVPTTEAPANRFQDLVRLR
jgi:Family of unknown function (DUF6386)